MDINRNKLYVFLSIACITGYIWLYFNLTHQHSFDLSVEVCLVKHLTNIPCPSCGSTRSVISLLNGNFLQALMINPLGYIVFSIMFFAPIWLVFDISTKRKTLFIYYNKAESILKKPKNSIPLILLITINWIWNITKEL
jgi:hypothetical protein